MKPHKGEITDWHRIPFRDHRDAIGYMIHGKYDDGYIRTDRVLKYDDKTGEIETSDSRYTLVGRGARGRKRA